MTFHSWRGVAALALLLALAPDAISADLTIGFDGIDAITIGTPLSHMRVPLEQPIQKFAQQPSGQCFYARPENDQRYAFMFIDDVLTRIDVMAPGLRTAAGVGVGDPLSRVREAYGRAIVEEPDFYDDAETYLTITSADGSHSIRFMTSHDKVSEIILGTTQAVRYVEECL